MNAPYSGARDPGSDAIVPRAPARPLRRLAAAAALLTVLAAVAGTATAQETTTTVAPATQEPTQEPTTTEPPGTDATTTTAGGSTTTTEASTTTAPTTTVAEEPSPPPAEDGGDTSTTLPTEPPPGFTEDQFNTFLDVVNACGSEPGWICSRLYDWTGNEAFAEGVQWVFDLPVQFILVWLVAWIATRIVRRLIDRSARSWQRRNAARADEEPDVSARQALRITTASATLASAASIVIYTIAAFVALAQLNVDLAPLLASAGIVGVALGFGAQNMVRDYLAGIFVIVEDQYGIGDTIDFGKAIGEVEGISLRMTKVRDLQGTLWFVPNGIITEVGNMSQRWARVILDVDVAYDADHHLAERLIKEAADEMWRDPDSEARLLEEPQMWGIQALAENSVQIRIAIKCAPAAQWAAARELRSRIKDSFDAAGIEIPFPQRTMWIRTPEDGPSDGWTRTTDDADRAGSARGAGNPEGQGSADGGEGPPGGGD